MYTSTHVPLPTDDLHLLSNSLHPPMRWVPSKVFEEDSQTSTRTVCTPPTRSDHKLIPEPLHSHKSWSCVSV